LFFCGAGHPAVFFLAGRGLGVQGGGWCLPWSLTKMTRPVPTALKKNKSRAIFLTYQTKKMATVFCFF
jgi:hypothetical protein